MTDAADQDVFSCGWCAGSGLDPNRSGRSSAWAGCVGAGPRQARGEGRVHGDAPKSASADDWGRALNLRSRRSCADVRHPRAMNHGANCRGARTATA